MKILVYSHLVKDFPQEWTKFIAEQAQHDFCLAETEDALLAEMETADVLISGRAWPRWLDAGKRLKAVFVPFTGVNTMDFAYLKKRSIQLVNNHGNSEIVAERAVALALALAGRVAEFHNDMRKGNWHRRNSMENPFDYWTSLQQRRIAYLGTGSIAKNIARLLGGFSTQNIGYNRHGKNPDPALFHKIAESAEEAISNAELIFLTVPLTAETRGLLDRRLLNLCQGKYLVNVSRGELIDEAALYEMLESRHLAGAALDAWFVYPKDEDEFCTGGNYPFLELPNLLASPHAASHTEEGKYGQFSGLLMNLRQYLETGQARDLVDLGLGY